MHHPHFLRTSFPKSLNIGPAPRSFSSTPTPHLQQLPQLSSCSVAPFRLGEIQWMVLVTFRAWMVIDFGLGKAPSPTPGQTKTVVWGREGRSVCSFIECVLAYFLEPKPMLYSASKPSDSVARYRRTPLLYRLKSALYGTSLLFSNLFLQCTSCEHALG